MKEELYIYTPDGSRELLDLPVPSGITLKWVNNLFSDISKLTCSHSYTFKLPFTQRNIRLLDLANDIRHHSKMIRKRVDADFYINGVCLCPNANLYVSEVGDKTFSCVLTWRVLKAFETLKSSGITLNQLPSLGRFIWRDDDDEFQYGGLSNKLGNMDDILYPDYDAGIPHEKGTPPKPVVPVYRLIQMINEKFGVKFEIGRQISRGMGLLPLANFNNKDYYGRAVYDDYVTYGVVPITGTKPFLSERYVAKEINLINLSYAIQDGSFQQEGSFRKFTSREDDKKYWREYENWRDINVSKRHYWGGIATLNGNRNDTVVVPYWNEFIGSDRLRTSSRETACSEIKVQELNMWKSWSQGGYYSGRYDGKDVCYAKRTVEGYMLTGGNKYPNDLVTLKLEAQCEIRGTATVVVKKSAVQEGRVPDREYWWIYLVEATKDENDEVSLDTKSDDGDDWIGLRSISREETATEYIYHFDFGVEYEARRLNVEAIEEGSLGYLFWSGYEYTPPEDTTRDLQTIYDDEGNELPDTLVAGYDNVNWPEVDFTDRFNADDVRFGFLKIASITPSLEAITKIPVEMNITENLPPINCFDFIKDVFYMNGALPRVEKDGKTIVAMYYNQLRDRMLSGDCLDWSDKLLSGKKQADLSKYENTNFGQKNYFEMAYSRRTKSEEEKRDELELYGEGYGTVGIEDSLLAEGKSLYQSKFFPGLRQDIAYPNVVTGRTIKTWDGEKHVVTTTNPLYGIMNYRALDPTFEETKDISKRPMLKSKGVDFKHIRMNAFEPFENIDRLFGYLGSILENYTCVKEKMMLTEFDLRDFNESVPVYLHKYNAFFAVSSIQRDKAGVCTVELVALPYVKPTYEQGESTDVETVSFEHALKSGFLSFTLNLKRTYTSNPCPLVFDLYVNNQNEGWSTSGNTLSEPYFYTDNAGHQDGRCYLSQWVSPYNDSWDGNPYTLKLYVAEKVRYTIKKIVGFDTEYEETLEAGLKVYYDDVLLAPGEHTKTFTQAEDGQYHVIKFAFDIYNREGELIHEYRKKLYYFVYTVDKSVINDDWGEEHQGETIVKVNDVTVSGPAVISNKTAQAYTLAYTPSYANVTAASVEVTADKDSVTVSDVSTSGFKLTANTLSPTEETVTLTIRTTLTDNSSFEVTHSVKLQGLYLAIDGAAGYEAPNGTGTQKYTIKTQPTSKALTVQSVTSSNNAVVVSDVTNSGFTLGVTNISSDQETVVTVVAECEGEELTATKEVVFSYKNSWNPDILDTEGVMIVDINGMFWTKKEWKNSGVFNEDADGIALSDGTHRFMMSKKTVEVVIGGYRETGMTPTETGFIINSEGTLVSGQFTTTDKTQALTDFNGKANTDAIIAQISDSTVGQVKSGHFPSGVGSYLATVGQLNMIKNKLSLVNDLLATIGGERFDTSNGGGETSSTQYNDKQEWRMTHNAYGELLLNTATKNEKRRVHPVADVRQVERINFASLSANGDDGVTGTVGQSKTVQYTFATDPAGATITDISVVSGSSVVTISDVTAAGFKATATIRNNDKVKITIRARVNGLMKQIERYLLIVAEGNVPIDTTRLDQNQSLIVDTDLNFYTVEEWKASGKSNDVAEGVAFSDGTHRFIIAKKGVKYSGGMWMSLAFGGSGVKIAGLEYGKSWDGLGNTQKIIASVTESDGYYKTEPYSAAAFVAAFDAFPSGKKGYLPAALQFEAISDDTTLKYVNSLMQAIGGDPLITSGLSSYWTSDIMEDDNYPHKYAYIWCQIYNYGYITYTQRSNKNVARIFRELEK